MDLASPQNVPAGPRYIPPFLRFPVKSDGSRIPPRRCIPHHIRAPPVLPYRGRPCRSTCRKGEGKARETDLFGEYMEGLGEELEIIPVSDIPSATDIAFRNVQYAGGYKWVENRNGEPTMAVPGIPDMWAGREGDIGQVAADRTLEGNEEWVDWSASHLPASISPLDPIFASLSHPSILEGVDLITSRNNLRKLFEYFKRPQSPDYRHPRADHWRIDAECIGRTVLLHRFERDCEKERAKEATTWHLSYHEAATVKILTGPNRTPGAQRMVRYDFGGLRCLVKFDVDAFDPDAWDDEVGVMEEQLRALDVGDPWYSVMRDIDSLSTTTQDGSDVTATTDMASTASEIATEDWQAAIDAMSTRSLSPSSSLLSFDSRSTSPFPSQAGSTMSRISQMSHFTTSISSLGFPRTVPAPPTDLSAPAVPNPPSISLNIIPASYPVPPHSALISLKTRSYRPDQPLDQLHLWSNLYASLLFAQVPTLHLALHDKGDFSVAPMRKIQLRGPEFDDVAQKEEGTLRKVRGILGEMVELTRLWGKVGFVGGQNGVGVFRWVERKGIGAMGRDMILRCVDDERERQEFPHFIWDT